MSVNFHRNLFVLLIFVFSLISPPVSARKMEPLKVQDKDIVDSKGKIVSMRGINFGGWLMMETWIPSIEMEWHDHLPRLAKEIGIEKELHKAIEQISEFDDDTEKIWDYIPRLHNQFKKLVEKEKYQAYIELFEREPSIFAAKDMDEVLRRRFGDYGAGEIWNAFHDIWITETDFQIAKAMGFNFIRLPFWYRWFENDDTPYEYNEYGFQYLDKAIAWAKEHGLYIMLDLHGAVGGQSPWDHTGELSRGEFFINEEFQKRTAALWKTIAKRYMDDTAVFAYDLLNEPFSAKGLEDWIIAHDMIYDAIRSIDSETIIVMEDGYKLEDDKWKDKGFFPDPKKMGWKNVVYSIHFYSGSDPLFSHEEGLDEHKKYAKEILRVGQMEQKRCNVPLYFGEFSTMDDRPNDIEGMKLFLELFNKQGWHWSPWTFKYVDDNNEGTIWGVYQYNRPWKRTPNIYRDSKESILETISKLGMENFSMHEDYGEILQECLAQPVHSAEKRRIR